MKEWLLSLVPYGPLIAAAATTLAALVALGLGLRRPKPNLMITIEQAGQGSRFYRDSKGEPYYVVTVANKGAFPATVIAMSWGSMPFSNLGKIVSFFDEAPFPRKLEYGDQTQWTLPPERGFFDWRKSAADALKAGKLGWALRSRLVVHTATGEQFSKRLPPALIRELASKATSS